jgi:hypothetical protein
MKRIVLAVICALTAVSAYGQTQTTPPGMSPCTLAAAKAPAIRGVKLGMKIDDVLAMFPGSAEKDEIKSAIAKADGYPNFGIVSIYVRPREYSTKDRFAGIADFRFVFFDGRVDQYEVQYDSPPGGPAWRRVDDWVAKLVDAFGLPAATDWTVDQNLSWQKNLKCDGFQLQASILNFRGNLTVSTLDPPYQKQQERLAAFEEKIRRDFKP